MTPQANDPRDPAAWVFKAEQDLVMAELGFRFKAELATDPICFHAQQCAEKYLKALLSRHAVDFPKTHDLEALLDLTLTLDGSLADLRPRLETLSAYAVETRYPGDSATADDAHKALVDARAVRVSIRARLGLAAD